MIDKPPVLATNWTDSKLKKYQSLMSCGYLHYDENIISMLEAQRDDTFQKTLEGVVKWLVKEIGCEAFGEPQYIPQSGKEPVIICLTVSRWETIKQSLMKEVEK